MVKDITGREVKVGDRIAYAVKHSTSVSVNLARVNGFGERHNYYGPKPKPTIKATREEGGRQVTIENTHTVVVING